MPPLRRSLVLLAALALPASAAHAEVRIGGPVGTPLPESPAGLSVETDVLPSWFAARGCQSPVREVLRQAGRPELRIGGNSQDRLQPVGPLPSNQRQIADAPFFHAVRCAGATRSPIILGLNLLARDEQSTGDLLAATGGLVPRDRLAIAIGNEPNLYGGRLPDPGGYAGYLELQGRTLQALRHRFGSFLPPLVGPDPAAYRWAAETAQFVREQRPSQATAHLYGLNGCRQEEPVTIPRLLDDRASVGLVDDLRGIAQAARDVGVPAQLTEVNSVACRGRSGVSDTPAAALWALKTMGQAASAGFRRFQFHTSIGVYDPFVLRPDGTIVFRPLWTAILLADALWPQGTQPRAVTGELPAGLRAWAARRPGGQTAVLLVNSDLTHAARTTVRTTATSGTLGRVTGQGEHAVRLNGRRLVWSPAAGRPVWHGTQRTTRLRPRDGRIAITLAPGTAAWALLGPDRAGRDPASLTAP